MDESVVFFGSGPLAAATLAFLAKNFDVEAVVTKPTTEAEMQQAGPGLAIYTVSNKQGLTELIAKKPFESRLAILVDFGIIVEKQVIDYFPLGIINSHFSLLPLWRGADPITFAILEGDAKTGVSLMLIDEQMDTGKLITQKTLHIKPESTTPSLTEELIALSNELLKDFVPQYVSGGVKPHNQPHPDRATYSRKLTKQDGIIDLNKSAEKLEQEIRAFAGWPGSRTEIAGKDVIITGAQVLTDDGQPGTIEVRGKELIIFAGTGTLSIEKLKPAGKKDMSAAEFIRGYLR